MARKSSPRRRASPVRARKSQVRVSRAQAVRPSPAVSAASQRLGTTMLGKDMQWWVVKRTRTGVRRWARM